MVTIKTLLQAEIGRLMSLEEAKHANGHTDFETEYLRLGQISMARKVLELIDKGYPAS